MRTWMLEQAAAYVVLLVVTLLSGASWIEYVGLGAVMLSFGHAQVADRLAEAEASRTRFDVSVELSVVECHAWATRYLVGKEVLWFLYFVLHRSWSALGGVGIFLAYPVWRRWWRSRRPRP